MVQYDKGLVQLKEWNIPIVLTVCPPGNFSRFLAVWCFSQNQLFRIILSKIPSEYQIDWIQIRSEVLLDLIWIQTVCKGYQQTTIVADDCGNKWALKKFIHFLLKEPIFAITHNAIN